jgi:hypothetical protein
MPEHNCSSHTKKVTVRLDEAKLEKQQRSNLIAGLLRVIAEYTDGFCAVELADDADIVKDSGMQFWFTTSDKQETFKNRIRIYLRADISGALAVS